MRTVKEMMMKVILMVGNMMMITVILVEMKVMMVVMMTGDCDDVCWDDMTVVLMMEMLWT